MINSANLAEMSTTLHEVVSICQCIEEATTEDHLKTALSVAIGMLLGLQANLSDVNGE